MEIVLGILGGFGGLLFFVAICLTMWRIAELKRVQEESLRTLLEIKNTLLEIKNSLASVTAVLTRNDTTAPPSLTKDELFRIL